jgi:MFS family permease
MSDSPPPEPPAEIPSDTSLRALLRQRDYILFFLSRWTAVIGVQVMSVALGWHIYTLARETMDIKRAALVLSMIGLVSFVPVLFLALPAGEAADRYNRRRILLLCYGAEIAVALLLGVAALMQWETIAFLLGAAVLFGASRAFFSPASTALGPMLVPRSLLPSAIAANSLAWQTGSIIGPALGGVLVTVSPATPYLTSLALYIVAMVCIFLVRTNAQPQVNPGSRWTLMKEGLAYVWNNRIVFGAISLDLAAVILGGATALLPVFARDVLHLEGWGFGILRAAPALGAAAVAIYLAINPIRAKAGIIMFTAVALFGAGTVIFGVSNLFWVSAAALVLLGGADMVSVYVRQTLIQLATPDNMRGRVATVSSLFIGASNELGEFESGVVARFLGPVGAAVFGGVGALAVTGLWAWMFPALRKADRLV